MDTFEVIMLSSRLFLIICQAKRNHLSTYLCKKCLDTSGNTLYELNNIPRNHRSTCFVKYDLCMLLGLHLVKLHVYGQILVYLGLASLLI